MTKRNIFYSYGHEFTHKEVRDHYKSLRDNPPGHKRVDTPEMVAYWAGYNRPDDLAPQGCGNRHPLLHASWNAGKDNREAERLKNVRHRLGAKNVKVIAKKKRVREYGRQWERADTEAYYKELRANPPQGGIAELRAQNSRMNAYGIGYQLPNEKQSFIRFGTMEYAAWAAGVDNRRAEDKLKAKDDMTKKHLFLAVRAEYVDVLPDGACPLRHAITTSRSRNHWQLCSFSTSFCAVLSAIFSLPC